jgi:hypothetical protein
MNRTSVAKSNAKIGNDAPYTYCRERTRRKFPNKFEICNRIAGE